MSCSPCWSPASTPATLALILVCVFGMVYTARVSQVVMAFFVTSMLGLLYSLLGTFSFAVLWIRVAETAVGAAAGILAAVVIVPVRTRSVMLDNITEVLDELTEFLEHAEGLLAGEENVNIIELSRDLDRAVEQVRTTIEPLTHPVNLRSARRDYGWHVLTTLETIAFRARHVAARAQPGQLMRRRRRPAPAVHRPSCWPTSTSSAKPSTHPAAPPPARSCATTAPPSPTASSRPRPGPSSPASATSTKASSPSAASSTSKPPIPGSRRNGREGGADSPGESRVLIVLLDLPGTAVPPRHSAARARPACAGPCARRPGRRFPDRALRPVVRTLERRGVSVPHPERRPDGLVQPLEPFPHRRERQAHRPRLAVVVPGADPEPRPPGREKSVIPMPNRAAASLRPA